MALRVETEPDTVRKFRIEIGSEFVACDFGRDIPRNEAMKRIRIMLDTFDKDQPHDN